MKIKKVVYTKENKFYWKSGDLHTQLGLVTEEELKTKQKVKNKDTEFIITNAGFLDSFEKLKRGPQIMLPKDIGPIITGTNLNKNSKVLEIGTGSGALTCFLSQFVKSIISYEIRPDHLTIAEKNLEDFYNDQSLDKLSSKKFFSFNRAIKALAIIGILLLISAMYLVLPKANIRISLKEMPVSATISVAVSKNISTPDFASGIIPGQYFLLTKSGSKIIETSNETVNIPSKYGGNIDIYNAYSTAAQKLVAQTRFETKDGKVFRIQNPIIIPGAKMSGSNLTPSFVKAEVISDTAGEEYQIGPSFFTIPGFKGTAKFAGFYAKSTEIMIPVKNNSTVIDQNVEKAKKDLENTLVTELKNEVLNTFKDSDLRLIDGASTVKVDEFNVVSNTATMKISWQAIFFKEKDFKSLVNYFISTKYSDLKNFDFKDKIIYPQAVKSDFKKGESFFTFNFNKSNVFTADLAGLKKELVGLNETGMRNIISDKNFINSATISLWPFWVRQSPGNPEKINIILDK